MRAELLFLFPTLTWDDRFVLLVPVTFVTLRTGKNVLGYTIQAFLTWRHPRYYVESQRLYVSTARAVIVYPNPFLAILYFNIAPWSLASFSSCVKLDRFVVQVALCALAQLFIVVTYPPLVRLLALETLGSGHFSAGAGTGEAAGVPPPPLLSLLQGDREELCLGALVVLQVR